MSDGIFDAFGDTRKNKIFNEIENDLLKDPVYKLIDERIDAINVKIEKLITERNVCEKQLSDMIKKIYNEKHKEK